MAPKEYQSHTNDFYNFGQDFNAGISTQEIPRVTAQMVQDLQELTDMLMQLSTHQKSNLYVIDKMRETLKRWHRHGVVDGNTWYTYSGTEENHASFIEALETHLKRVNQLEERVGMLIERAKSLATLVCGDSSFQVE